MRKSLRFNRVILPFTLSISLQLFTGVVDAAAYPSIEAMLPSRFAKADIMEARPPARAIELGQQFDKAVSAKPQWWADYVKEHAETRPLPYHRNFGLTAAEYKEFIDLADKFELVKTGESRLIVKRLGQSVELQIDEADRAVQPIRIDLKGGGLITPMARIDKAEQRDSGAQGGALGPHRSHVWQKTQGDPDSGTFTSVSFTLGTITKSGREFLQYRVAKVYKGEPKLRYEILLMFEGQDEQAARDDNTDKDGDHKNADENDRAALEKAIFFGKLDDVKELIGAKVGVNDLDSSQNTPLFVAVRHRKPEIITYLIENGADVNAVNRFGHTPLWQAVLGNQLEIVELLVTKGAKVDAPDKFERTPLFQAILSRRDDIAEYLIKKGADFNHRDKTGKSPLKVATDLKNESAAALLRKHGAK